MPGDPQPAPVAPADGGEVQTDPAGIEVTFTCPRYRSSYADESTTAGAEGYTAVFSRRPDFVGVASDPARSLGGDRCSARLDDDGDDEVTPGKVYWRLDRSCYCSPSQEYESSPTYTFTLRAPKVFLRNRIQKRAYAGYAFTAHLRTDAPDGTRALLMLHRRGDVQIGEATSVHDGRAQVDVKLPRGPHRLLWRLDRGDVITLGPIAKVDVRRARTWSTGARDDGRYKDENVAFRVARRGRQIRDFKASLTAFCVGPTLEDNRLVTTFAAVKRARIAPDGRFLTRVTVSKTDEVLRGRLRSRTVTGGRIEVSYSTCSGSLDFTARRK